MKMRACTIFAIFSLASLALVASTNDLDQRRGELYKEMMKCCKTTKVLVSIFHSGGITCGGKYLMGKVSNWFQKYYDPTKLEQEFQDGCLVECIFDANNFLRPDKSLIKSDFKRKLLAKADDKGEEVTALIDTALTKCFDFVAKNPVPADSPGCKSNSQILISCVARYILLNCPASAWKDNRDKCEGKRVSFIEEVTALDKKVVEAAKVQV